MSEGASATGDAEPPSVAAVATAHRGELFGVAYRLLGSVAEAEDAVQEAFARLQHRGLAGLDRPAAWLARVTSRICLDRLRSAPARREQYVGPWLPEPLVDDGDPAAAAERGESVSMALLLVLETLGPAERVALVLHDVFGYGYDELADVLDRSQGACRQLVARARRAVRQRRPRFEADPATRDAAITRFLTACRSGELAPLLETLAPDVEMRADGGGLVSAARKPVCGPERVARFVLGLLRQAPEDVQLEAATVNGARGLVVRRGDGRVDSVVAFDVADERVRGVYTVRNPRKLAHLR